MPLQWGTMETVRGKLVPYDAKAIRAVMTVRGIDVATLSRRSGVPRQTLDFILAERNQRMRQKQRAQLARVLRVPISVIEGGGVPDAVYNAVARWMTERERVKRELEQLDQRLAEDIANMLPSE